MTFTFQRKIYEPSEVQHKYLVWQRSERPQYMSEETTRENQWLAYCDARDGLVPGETKRYNDFIDKIREEQNKNRRIKESPQKTVITKH